MLHSKSTKDQKTHDNLNSHRKSICQNPTSNPDLKKKKKKKTSGNKKQMRTSPIWEKPSTHTDTHGHTHTPPKTVNIILNGEKLECFPPKIKNKSRISTLITSTEHCTRSSGQCNQARKRNKQCPYCKGRRKILFTDNMITYLEKNKINQKTTRINRWV